MKKVTETDRQIALAVGVFAGMCIGVAIGATMESRRRATSDLSSRLWKLEHPTPEHGEMPPVSVRVVEVVDQ